MKNQIRYWVPTIVWAVVIFGFSSRQTITTSQVYWQDFVIKKAAHLFEYGLLGILLYRSLKHSFKLDKLAVITLTLSLVALYAITDEFHQSFTPGREPRLRDVMIDTLGAVAALWLVDRQRIITL